MSNPTTANLPNQIGAADLASLADRLPGLAILDVRTPAEYESVHIPGSLNLPLDQLPGHTAALRDAGQGPLVLVCRSGQRAQEAERELIAAGCEGVHRLEGGLASWEACGLPVNRGRQRWSMERQVRGVAGSLVLLGALGGLLIKRPLGLLAAGVGGGLLFSAVSDTCTMAKFLSKLPYNQGAGCDADAVVQHVAACRAAAVTAHAAD